MILDDIQVVVERHGEEMQIEGIDALHYWAKELGISRNELYDFIEMRAKEIDALVQVEGVRIALMSGWMDGFVKGYFTHRERRGVAPT